MNEQCLYLILANLVYFFKTLCFKYSSDDIPVFHQPPKTRNVFEKLWFWFDGRLRLNPQPDHMLTTFIHTAVCVFIYLGFGKNDVSFLAALLFAFNPTNNQGSVWISGRSYALAALGMTGAMAFPVLAGVFLWLAAGTNPGFLALTALVGSKWLAYFWLPILVAWLLNWKRFKGNVSYKMQKEMLAEDKAIKPEKLVLAIKTFGFYTMLTLIPFKNAFYHSFVQSSSGSGRFKAYSMKDRFFWFGLGFIGLAAWYIFTHKWDMVSFGILWWMVCLAPFCNFLRMSQEIAERYVYLPAVGLMFVLASLISAYPVLIAVFLTAYSVRLWFLMDMYQDDYYLLEHSCILDPSSWFVWHVRGIKRWDHKSYQEAVIIWSMARLLSPNEFKVNFNLATVLATNNNMQEAKHYLAIAEKNIPPGQERESGALLDQWKKGTYTILL